MQTKLESLYESMCNVAIGLTVALLAQFLYFYCFGITIGIGNQLGLAAWMTLISITRSYLVRRHFNKKLSKTTKVEK